MARGILDSLMSATYFNASALRLLRQLVFNIHNFHHHHNNFSYDQYHYHKTQYYYNNRVNHFPQFVNFPPPQGRELVQLIMVF